MAIQVIENVESSSVEALQYDSENQTLTVEFKGGAVYEYANVPEETFTSLTEAESIGRYLNDNVKGTYDYQKK